MDAIVHVSGVCKWKKCNKDNCIRYGKCVWNSAYCRGKAKGFFHIALVTTLYSMATSEACYGSWGEPCNLRYFQHSLVLVYFKLTNLQLFWQQK